MPTALFLSPHLDDVVFSCGGFAAVLADRGWNTVLVTVFTRSVMPASGFALACQLDKGLAADVDYMALRRAEDQKAADILGFRSVRWLDLPEAPHRGYDSAAALFDDLLEGDAVSVPVSAELLQLGVEFRPDLVLVPQGLGNHVDHRQVTAAAVRCFRPDQVGYYRDTPYAIRVPGASPQPGVPTDDVALIGIAQGSYSPLDRKVAAAQAYASQVGFQFGGAEALARALRSFAVQEGDGIAAERLFGRAVMAVSQPATP